MPSWGRRAPRSRAAAREAVPNSVAFSRVRAIEGAVSNSRCWERRALRTTPLRQKVRPLKVPTKRKGPVCQAIPVGGEPSSSATEEQTRGWGQEFPNGVVMAVAWGKPGAQLPD